MLGLDYNNILEDGKALVLHKDPSLWKDGLTDVEKDFCEYYGVDYPLQAYYKIMEDNNTPNNGSIDPYVEAFLPTKGKAPEDVQLAETAVMNEAQDWLAKLIKAKESDLPKLKEQAMDAFEKAGLADVEKWLEDNWQAAFDKAAQYK